MNYEEIISGLRALKAEEFVDYVPERLSELTEAVMELPVPERAIPELFAVMERLPDSDLGSPGPLVHTLERLNYVDELVASMRRCPTPLAIWMVNRILNSPLELERRQFFIELLSSVAGHPQANESAQNDAELFIEFQKGRRL